MAPYFEIEVCDLCGLSSLQSACPTTLFQVFAKCMKSIWRGWIQTVRPLHTTSVSCLTSLTTWQIWAVLCKYTFNARISHALGLLLLFWFFFFNYYYFYSGTELILKHTNRTTKTGLRKRYMSCCGVRLNKRQSKGVFGMLSYYTLEELTFLYKNRA